MANKELVFQLMVDSSKFDEAMRKAAQAVARFGERWNRIPPAKRQRITRIARRANRRRLNRMLREARRGRR